MTHRNEPTVRWPAFAAGTFAAWSASGQRVLGGLGILALGSALLVEVGTAPPLDWGLGVPLVLWVVAVALGEARARAFDGSLQRAGGWTNALMVVPSSHRSMLLVLCVLVGCVMLATLATSCAQLLVTFPAAMWALIPVVFAAVTFRMFAAQWIRTSMTLVLVLAVPMTGAMGTVFEAGGVDARGAAYSGPILGIHPFQSTAVLVDGYGPFDIVINDYVEPDGSRGYGPDGLARAIDRALEAIAQQQFANGPERARRAFADAEVQAWMGKAVGGHPGNVSEQVKAPRFVVRSGTYGDRSRVEFVCPGIRNDPRPLGPDTVMTAMCPDKYASEASAGLGVTGRWPGYTEVRGNARVSLASMFGATNTDDAVGASVAARERFVWAVVSLVACLAIGRAVPGRAADGIRAVGGGVALTVLLVMVASVLVWLPPSQTALVERAPPWLDADRVAPWLALAVPLVGPVALARRCGPGAAIGPPPRVAPRMLFVPVLLAIVAGGAVPGFRETLSVKHRDTSLEMLLLDVADRASRRLSADVFELESMFAAALLVVLLAGMVVLVRDVSSACSWDVQPASATRRLRLGSLFVVPALLLAGSPATHHGKALLPAAVALGLVLWSAVGLVVRRGEPGGWLRACEHALWIIGALVVFFQLPQAELANPVVLLAVGIGTVAAVSSSLLVFGGTVASGTAPAPLATRLR